MEVFDCIKTRRSVRKFQKKEVSWDNVSMILDAGRLASSAGNLQNWKFIVVLDEAKRQAVAEACVKQLWLAEAPVQIIIVGEPEKAKRFYGERGANLYTAQNCAAAAQNMLLEAHNLGLAGCWVGAFEENAIRRIFGMPSEVIPYVIIPIGHPDEKVGEPAKFPIENVTYFNNWRGKVKDVPAYFNYYSHHVHAGAKKVKEAAKKSGKTAVEKAKQVASKIKDKLKEKNT